MSALERASEHGGVDLEGEHHEPAEHEKPEDWGWHADLHKQGHIAGWICVVVLAIGLTATHYNLAGTVAILLTMLILVIGLLWDRHQRKNSWR